MKPSSKAQEKKVIKPRPAPNKKPVAYFNEKGELVITDKNLAEHIKKGSAANKIEVLAEIVVTLPKTPPPKPVNDSAMCGCQVVLRNIHERLINPVLDASVPGVREP